MSDQPITHTQQQIKEAEAYQWLVMAELAERMRERSPIGFIPRWLHEELRAEALAAAIGRYEAAGFDPLPEWREELAELGEAVARRAARRARNAEQEAEMRAGEADESWRDRPAML